MVKEVCLYFKSIDFSWWTKKSVGSVMGEGQTSVSWWTKESVIGEEVILGQFKSKIHFLVVWTLHYFGFGCIFNI